MKSTYAVIRLSAAIVVCAASAVALACPFCSVESQTLSEETQSADAVVLAKLLKEAPPVSDAADPNSGTAQFEIIEVLRGQDAVAGAKQIDVVYFGESDRERIFLIMGLGAENPDWTTPLPLSDEAVDYLRKLPGLPASGADRLAYFQEFLENDDPLLAQDAYDEFARAPYEDVIALGPRMHHDLLMKWVADLEINPSRRRLYFTMLGACGNEGDLPLLESLIVSDFNTLEPQLNQLTNYGLALGGPIGLAAWPEIVGHHERQKKLGLDALVACYLKLRGPEGLDLIDERFLKRTDADYTHIYSTIMALRFHGDQETGVLPKERLLTSMRLLLDNPDFADQVILDLSRWEDWSMLDRLVEMFKTTDKKGYVRQPVITYLTVASEQPGDVGPRAAAALKELEAFDPETVKQARSLMAFGVLGRARANKDATAATDKTSDENDQTAAADATQGFSASAEDEETDVSEIPDPAAYEEREANAVADNQNETAANNDVAAEPGPKSHSVSKTDSSVARSTHPAAEAAPPEPVLIVGVPLAAAVILMGVYWLILRTGRGVAVESQRY